MGEPPEDKLSDASNSPDYRNVSSPEDNTRDNKVSNSPLVSQSLSLLYGQFWYIRGEIKFSGRLLLNKDMKFFNG